MKGVTFLKDESNNKRILQVDIREVSKNPSQFEDLMDVLIAEERKDEKRISWADAKKRLKKNAKA